jgi:hypothetical protein
LEFKRLFEFKRPFWNLSVKKIKKKKNLINNKESIKNDEMLKEVEIEENEKNTICKVKKKVFYVNITRM